MKKITRYFLQGLIFIAPLSITVYIIYLIIRFTDNLIKSYVEELFNFTIPGLGIISVFLLLTLLGFIGQSVIFKPIKKILWKILDKTPLIKTIYTSINEFMNAIFGKEKKFNQPVLVRVNKIFDLEKIGFITEKDLSKLHLENKVAVYFPHSYNFSGELFIVPTDAVTQLDIPAADAMKFIVSGGVSKL